MSEHNETSGWDLLKRLRFQWKLALIVFTSLCACVVGLVLLLPNQYRSHLKLVVKNGRVDPMVGSGQQTQEILNVNDISDARINTEIQLLTSSQVLREVVQRVHLAELGGNRKQAPGRREEAALDKLQHDLMVVPIHGSNVIEVSYESPDARRSQQVVSAVWQAYTQSSRGLHGVPGSLEVFAHLAADYDTRLAAAQDRLLQYREQHGIVSVPEEQTLQLANAAHLRGLIAESAALQQKNAAVASDLRQQMESLPAQTERDRRSMPNLILTQQLTSLLVTLENKRTESAARYQPGDRLLKELDTEIDHTRQALAESQRPAAAEVSLAANPTRDLASSEYLRAVAESAGARAQGSELSRQLQKTLASLAVLSSEGSEYAHLVEAASELEKLDATYHQKTEEARLEQSLDEQRISNLAVVDAPFVSYLPSLPKRGLLLAVGVLWSALLAVFVAGVVEASAGRLRAPLELGPNALGPDSVLPLLANYSAAALPPASTNFAELYAGLKREQLPAAAGAKS